MHHVLFIWSSIIRSSESSSVFEEESKSEAILVKLELKTESAESKASEASKENDTEITEEDKTVNNKKVKIKLLIKT